MTIYVDIMPTPSNPLVVALLYDGLCTFEFGIVAEIFGLARPEMGPSWYRFQSCAIEQGPLRAHGGFTLIPDAGTELIGQANVIVIPGWKAVDAPVPEELCDTLRAAHDRGVRLASLCSGAFVLAATGLLDGKSATTHWRYADALRSQYPAINVDETSLYRIEDGICTSAGSAAGIDLMIEIVRQDFGPDAANSVARRIVMPGHRSGGQAQYLERPVRTRPDAEIVPVLDVIRNDLHLPWSIAEMARTAKMSKRTFERRFGEATGQCPGEWLNKERVEAAKDILTRSNKPIEEIATAIGFGSAHTLRHHFRLQLKQTPSEFRREFSLGSDRFSRARFD